MKIESAHIFEKLNRLDIKIRYVLFAVVLVAILIVDFLTIIPFQWKALQKTNADNLTLQQNIDRLKIELQRFDQIKSGLKNSKEELEEANKNIQSGLEVPAILEEISKLASSSDVKINQLKPQMDSQQTLMTIGNTKYYSLPIVIQATSGYHTFGRFLSKLEDAKLITSLSNFKIEGHAEGGRDNNISVTIRVVLSEKVVGISENKDKDGKKK